MIITTVKMFCDRCGKDVTDEYNSEISILFRNGMTEEVDPEGKMFCSDCMLSFNKWMKEGKKNE